jgi:hypothetical protein
MSPSALSSPTLKSALIALTLVLSALALFATPAQAAGKPCWKLAIDDWVEDGRIDGVYSTACLQQARKHLPEDLRAYSNIEEAIDESIQVSRTVQGRGGGGGGRANSNDPTRNVTPEQAKEITEKAGKPAPEEGPIDEVLNAGGPSSADSVPLPLIILTGLALVLLAAGAAGVAHRKLAARKIQR